MVNSWVPDEICMEQWPQVVPFLSLFLPIFNARLIEYGHFQLIRLPASPITLKKVAEVFYHLIANLQPHALFRNRLEQCFEHGLCAITFLVAGKIRSHAP